MGTQACVEEKIKIKGRPRRKKNAQKMVEIEEEIKVFKII